MKNILSTLCFLLLISTGTTAQKSQMLDCSCSDIKPIFEDLTRYGSFHPLIKDVVQISEGPDNIAKIIEQPFRLIPIKIHYYARVHSSGSTLSYSIFGITAMAPQFDMSFDSVSNTACRYNYEINIKGNSPFKKLLQRKMYRAQESLLNAIISEPCSEL